MMTGQFIRHSQFSQLPQQLVSYQEYDNLRLQRLKQQRKRMETMYEIIVQQKNKIDCYEQDISNQDQKIKNIRKQTLFLKENLRVNQKQKENIKQIIMKQEIVIRSFKNILSSNTKLSLLQKEQILQQSGYREWQTLNFQIDTLEQPYLDQFKPEYKNQIYATGLQNELRFQIRMMHEKYQQLCQDYRQLTKHSKTIQFQLMKTKHQQNQKTLNQKFEYIQNESKRFKCSHSKNKQSSNLTLTNKKQKHCHRLHITIQTLQQQIQGLSQQIKKKNILIDKYHQTQNQHHKLIAALKKKLKEQSLINVNYLNNQNTTSKVIVSTRNMKNLSPQKQAELDINKMKIEKNQANLTSKQKSKVISSEDQKQNIVLKKTINTKSKSNAKQENIQYEPIKIQKN